MKTSELREKTIDQLKAEATSLLKAHFGLRMQKATQQLGNTATMKQVRRDVARVKTIIQQKRSEAKK